MKTVKDNMVFKMPRKRSAKKKSAKKAASKSSKGKQDMKLLESGVLPEETKLGTPFKGKNKVVIA